MGVVGTFAKHQVTEAVWGLGCIPLVYVSVFIQVYWKGLSNCVYTCGVCACGSICISVKLLLEATEGTGSPGVGVTGDGKHPHMGVRTKLRSSGRPEYLL